MIDLSQIEESMVMSSFSRSHFRDWVPEWLKIVVAFILLIPVLLINGAYTGSNVDIVGTLGVLSEDINMAFYASAVGMAVAHLLMPYVKPIVTAKTILLISLFTQVILSLICAETEYIEIITFCSFWIGYLKAFSMSEIIDILIPVMSRKSQTRNEFYSKFYPITLGFGQLSMVLTAELAYQFQWQYMYYFMILMLLVSMFIIAICMTYAKRIIHFPFKTIDWLSFFNASIFLMCIIYVVTYGKTKDWFASTSICVAIVVTILTGWLFIYRQLIPDRQPFSDLSVFKNRSSRVSYIFCFIFMFFASFNVLLSSYTTNILHLGSDRANELYLYMIPGVVVGGFICYWFYLKAIRMAWLIFTGMSCFVLSILYLYFIVMPTGLYSDLYLPMFLRGIGMVIFFVAFGVYAVQGLKRKQLIYNVFYIIAARSALAPAVGYSIITNWLYRLQLKNIMVLSETINMQNPLAASKFDASVKSAMAHGMSIENAKIIATNSLYNQVQVQANMVSIKTILGWMLILGIILLVVILLYFFQFKPVRWMRVGEDMKA